MNEKHHGEEGYWDQQNFGECVVDMLKNCEDYLRSAQLPDYFVNSKNILEGKDPSLLRQLADHFHRERAKLMNL